jgi:hypothetical protein
MLAGKLLGPQSVRAFPSLTRAVPERGKKVPRSFVQQRGERYLVLVEIHPLQRSERRVIEETPKVIFGGG